MSKTGKKKKASIISSLYNDFHKLIMIKLVLQSPNLLSLRPLLLTLKLGMENNALWGSTWLYNC